MARFGYNPDGSVTVYSRYDNKLVPNLMHIFPDDGGDIAKRLLKRKKGNKDKLRKVYHIDTHSSLLRKIFRVFLEKIFDKVADGHLFMLPGITKAHIVLKAIPDKEVKFLRQNGYYKDYDIVAAGFKIPRFVLDFGPNSRLRDMQIYVPLKYREKAFKNAQEGKIPYTTIAKERRTYDSRIE